MRALTGDVCVVSPLTHQNWNESVMRCTNSTIFHSENWARLLQESYGYHPIYLTLSDGDDLKACLPVMEVNSIITGRRGVCLSFSDYCLALVEERSDFQLLFQRVLELGASSKWRYMEFRGEAFLDTEVAAKSYAHHEVELNANVTEMFSRLRESTARNIRKAIKEGVAVKISHSRESVMDYYHLHCLTRKRQGVPPQPAVFFHKLYEHLIAPGFGFTALASHGDNVVAATICLHFGKKAVYKYGASDLRYQHLRANNLTLWESMKRCATEGCDSFSLGRTDLDNEGLIAFKNGWGGTESTLKYYKYDFSAGRFVTDRVRDMALCRNMLKKMPLNILSLLGKLSYPHMG